METAPPPDPAALLAYASHPKRNGLRRRTRVALAALYLALTFLPCLMIGMAGQLPMRALIATFLTYAFALLPTYYFDHGFLAGNGFHSPAIFGVFILFVAAMLWPLPLLSAAPGVWRSARWRRAILGYAAAFALFAAGAAWTMTRSWHLFFG